MPTVWATHEWEGAAAQAGIETDIWEHKTQVVCLMGINGCGRSETEDEKDAQAFKLTAQLKAIIKEKMDCSRTNADWLVIMRKDRELRPAGVDLRNILSNTGLNGS